MIARLLKKLVRTQPAAKPEVPVRLVPGENCALWHDVARALDQSTQAANQRGKVKGVAR